MKRWFQVTLLALAILGHMIAAPKAAMLSEPEQWNHRLIKAEGVHWRMSVRLRIEPDASTIAVQVENRDGTARIFQIQMPPLANADDPFDGYIDATGALLPPESGWLPRLPAGAEGWRVTVETPPGFIAVPYPGGDVTEAANGGHITTFDVELETARAPLIIGKFVFEERDVAGVKLRTFFSSRNAQLSDSYMEAMGEAIASLSERIGPYPYPAFAVVESPLPVGLGFPGYTLVSGRILPLPFMRGRSLWHEIAHVWWGNGVFVDYEHGNWAEGFAAFFADYALAEAKGRGLEHRYDWLLEYDAVPPSADYALRQFVSKGHSQSQAIGYGKAAMVLVMLQDKIGLDAFDAGIKRFWRMNRGRIAGWNDIEAAFAAETDKPLAAFFKRWLDTTGAAPPDAADSVYRVFRELGDDERIQTLRMLTAAKAFTVEMLAGAPGAKAELAGLFPDPNSAKAVPVLIGDRAALKAIVRDMPPEGPAAIWATRDQMGRAVIAMTAPDVATLKALSARARHYGRWSWLVVGDRGRPQRGRWPIGGR